MRLRIVCVAIILTVMVSMRSVQLVSAGCNTSVTYSFPKSPIPGYYTISASKTDPDRPVVKQQLEELFVRGDLPHPPEYYNAKFSASLSLAPGTATWNHAYSTWEWKYFFSYCTKENVCPGVWNEIKHCDPQQVIVYRSIQTMKVFLIPSIDMLNWYWDWEQSPTVMYAYPDFWMNVTIGEDGGPSWAVDNLSGLHFYYSVPLRDATFFLPSKLNQIDIGAEVINPTDAKILDQAKTKKIIPVCDYDSSNGITKYPYQQRYDLNTDIDLDLYDCNFGETTTVNDQYTSIELKIEKYDFDIPGTFYIGVVAQISPAVLPASTPNVTSENQPQIELPNVEHPYYFDPSNISDGSYINTEFTVWMLVSTPCWTGDGGCNIENPPK